MNNAVYMQHAMRLAARGLGTTAPNPSVGCVLVRDEQIVGTGWTQAGGRPHAEAVALSMAGNAAKDATAYVTLEPCAHEGETPSCARLLVEAGISVCYIAAADPDARTNGRGKAILKDGGVAAELVDTDHFNPATPFIYSKTKQHPWVTLKLATTADGMIAESPDQPSPITGELARAVGQRLRASHDAIVTGAGTVRADNPQLTCRLQGLTHQSPIRIILGELPAASHLASSNSPPVWHYSRTDDLSAFLKQLTDRGITSLLIEAGQKLSSSFLRAGLVDAIEHFQSDHTLGMQAYAALDDPALWPSQATGWRRTGTTQLADDTLRRYEKKHD